MIALGLVVGLSGCRGKKKTPTDANENAAAPIHMPRYAFADGLRVQHPELCDFLQAFFETCLSGDYEGYRKFVSRRQQPEPRDRFERIYDAIELLSGADLRARGHEKLPVFGEDRRAIAILVFPEEGEWRMVPAPSELQPQRRGQRATATSSAPAEDAAPVVEYPWEDYADGG